MASYFNIFDDRENKTICVARKDLTKKQTRSVLGEISQNTKKQPKLITESDGCKVFSENYGAQTIAKKIFHSNFISHSHNKENSFSTHPTAKIKADELKSLDCSIVSISDNNDSSVFQDTSMVQWSVDIFAVPEYSREIYQYLKDRETQRMPKWNYMEKQADITFSMRAILVDWLVEVAEEYKLNTETIYLTVSYIDRFLSFMSVDRAKLQLVGTACMFIAAKYEEMYPPGVGEFAFITDSTYTKKQVLRMEHLILKVLGFDMSVPTSHQFVNHYCRMFSMDGKALHLALYINELCLLDGRTFMKFPPSVQAASSVVLARHTLGIVAWSDTMAAEVDYSLDDLKECVVGLYETFVEAQTMNQQSIREKYKHYKLSNVADVSPVDIM